MKEYLSWCRWFLSHHLTNEAYQSSSWAGLLCYMHKLNLLILSFHLIPTWHSVLWSMSDPPPLYTTSTLSGHVHFKPSNQKPSMRRPNFTLHLSSPPPVSRNTSMAFYFLLGSKHQSLIPLFTIHWNLSPNPVVWGFVCCLNLWGLQ